MSKTADMDLWPISVCRCTRTRRERKREVVGERENILYTLGALVSTFCEMRLIIAHSYKRFSRIN